MKQGNTFAGTAFIAYGAFWWSLVIIWMFASAGLDAWGTFTAFMFIGTLTHNCITQIVFGSLTILFFLLAIGDFTNISGITRIAGYVGLFCGASAMYNAVGQIINNKHNKAIFPL